VSCSAERTVALTSLQPDLAQLFPHLHPRLAQLQIVLRDSPQLRLSVCKLTPGGELTFTRLFKILTKNRLELWRVELRVSKEGIVVVDQLGGVVVLVDLQLRVPVSVLTDRTELALSSRHEVFAECTFVVRVDFRQILLDCPQFYLCVGKVTASSEFAILYFTAEDGLVLRTDVLAGHAHPVAALDHPQLLLPVSKATRVSILARSVRLLPVLTENCFERRIIGGVGLL